ncbi:fucolectin-1-like [Lacerta agilis]|uniref:fucolectin-1-like n=1 Tax=Lacerta agilis TaxID=80427 RepID=UPI0014198966|nr:fucolectin-1-like [Lacerta agilis]
MLNFRTLLLALALLEETGQSQSYKSRYAVLNLAKGRRAYQSSTFPYAILGSADKAVDGIYSGDFQQGSCAHTDNDKNPWWFVDLDSEYAIAAVLVKNRADCCGERLLGAEVRVGNTIFDHGKFNTLCGIVKDITPGSVSSFYCRWLRGRYVSIHLPRHDYLTLCEVDVYGAVPKEMR